MMDGRVQKLLKQRVQKEQQKVKLRVLNVRKTDPEAHERLLRRAEALKTTPMNKYLERMIVKQVKARPELLKAYPDTIPRLMVDAKEEYERVLHQLGVARKVRPLEGVCFGEVLPYKQPGKTGSYGVFLRRRKELKKEFILQDRKLGRILRFCVTLPEMILDFKKFRREEPWEIGEFLGRFQEELDVARLFVKGFHKDVMSYLRQVVKTTGCDDRSLKACNGLLSIHLSNMVVNTIEDAVRRIEDSWCIPKFLLKAYTTFEDDKVTIKVDPCPNTLTEIFVHILHQMTELVGELPALETVWSSKPDRFISLFINEEIFITSRKRIEVSIANFYQPILHQILQLQNDFQSAYSNHQVKRIGEILAEDITFERGAELVKSLRVIYNNLNSKVSNHYYLLGTLIQTQALFQLKHQISDLMLIIFNNLRNQHLHLNEDICDQFFVLKFRATKRPDTTEELMAMGEYMALVNSMLLEDMNEKVSSSLKMAASLLELNTVTPEHQLLMLKAFKCVQEIPQLIEYNQKLYEQTKSEFEEYLQKKTEDTLEVVLKMIPYLVVMDDMDDSDNAREYLEALQKFISEIKEIDKEVNWINKEEICFKFQQTNYPELNLIKTHVYNFYHLLNLCNEWSRLKSSFLDGPFEFLIVDEATRKIGKLSEDVKQTQKEYKNSLRQSANENPILKFKGSADDPDFMNLPAPLKLCQKVVKQMEEFVPVIKLMEVICNDALFPSHWQEMSQIAGVDLEPNAGSTLRKYWGMDLMKDIDKYEIISASATKEKQILVNLLDMQEEWQGMLFKVDGGRIVGIEEVKSILDDHVIKTENMQLSVFVKPHEEKVDGWLKTLKAVDLILEVLIRVQTLCFYLKPLFERIDVASEIPDEDKLFRDSFHLFEMFIEGINSRAIIVERTKDDTIVLLDKCQKQLEELDFGLNNYVLTKRLAFPRFFFLSKKEVLDVYAKGHELRNLQQILFKSFEGIKTLKFNQDNKAIGMYSSHGEYIDFIEAVEPCERLENWFRSIETQMIATIKNKIVYFTHTEAMDPIDSPGQAVQVASKILLTKSVEESLDFQPNHLKSYLKKLEVTTNNLIHDRKSTLTNGETIKKTAFIIQNLNDINTIKSLLEQNPSTKNFFWLSQLRYYLKDFSCEIQTIHMSLYYQYEYLGNTTRIITTPSTEKCFRTLLLAKYIQLGAALFGNSGSGKSELVKDLSKAIGSKCVTFNCSHMTTQNFLSTYIRGAAASGSTVCLSNVDRIRSEVLSVVAQDVMMISMAKKAREQSVLLDGIICDLKVGGFLCVTMSPGYKGRNEIPFNLRVLFRPIAVPMPDFAVISEVNLRSKGFLKASRLSGKIKSLFLALRHTLRCTNWYDHGVRTLNSLLASCTYEDDCDEDVLLLRAIISTFTPKLHQHDTALFTLITSNIFPEAARQTETTSKFQHRCETFAGLAPKILQFQQTLQSRRGCILCGETLSGKSRILEILAEVREVVVKTVNPGAIEEEQLMSLVTEWLLEDYDKEVWIVFDGPIEPKWVENLNTVLEENGSFCLNSGEVIEVGCNVSLIFEVDDVSNATPATTSRCGLVYVPESTITIAEHIHNWLLQCSSQWCKDHFSYIHSIFTWSIPPTIDFLRSHCSLTWDPGNAAFVLNTLRLFHISADEAFANCREMDVKYWAAWVQASAIFAGAWSLGGSLQGSCKEKFDEFYRKLWRGGMERCEYPNCLEKLDVVAPSDGFLTDYLYVYKNRGNWKHWMDATKSVKIEELSYVDTLVPTVDSEKYCYLIKSCLSYGEPVMLIGGISTGKTFYTNNVVKRRLEKKRFYSLRVVLSAGSTYKDIQKAILSNLSKTQNNVYRAFDKKTCLAFIDDLNLPKNDSHFELIRQILDKNKNWLDVKSNIFLTLENLTFVCTNNSNCKLPTRFLRHFSTFTPTKPEDENLLKIYSTLLSSSYKKSNFPSDVLIYANHITNATIKAYNFILDHFKQTPRHIHYTFNLRHVSKVIYGCGQLKREGIEDKKVFGKLWLHEILRAFGDSLMTLQENSDLCEHILEISLEYFKELSEAPITISQLKSLMFGENEEIQREVLKTSAESFMKGCGDKTKLVLFDYALEHLSKLCRIISVSSGNGVLLGVEGCGRKSLSELAANLCKQKLFQPNISDGYGLKKWRLEIKTALVQAGCGSQSVFLLNEEQMTEENFLEDIDYFLNGGDVTKFYSVEEKKGILELVRLAAQGGNKKADITYQEVFSYFTKKCEENLHFLLVLNYNFCITRKRFLKYPSLSKICWVCCFPDWPKEALEAIARVELAETRVTDEIRELTIESSIHFHRQAQQLSQIFTKETGRITHVTPTSYLDLLKTFSKLIGKKQAEISAAIARYRGGLTKLEFASEQIAKMSSDLSKLKPELQEMSKKAAVMAREIVKEANEVEVASNVIRKDEEVANLQAAEAEMLKSECEADLALAIPILEDAIVALNTLKPSDITLVKSMKNPPNAIKLVMAAVCVIKDIKPDRIRESSTGRIILDYWGPSKRLLGEMNFLQQLKEFDKDDIKPEIMVKIRKEYVPHADFKPKIVAKASSAAEGLCKWIIAMDMYDKVAKEVAPKKEKLERAEKQYATTMKILNEKKEQVVILEERLEDLHENLRVAHAKQRELQDEVELCTNKLRCAEKLIGGLGGEKIRWTERAEELQAQHDTLAGDILVSSAVIAYLSPFNAGFRNDAINNWLNYIKDINIPLRVKYVFTDVLCSEVKIQNWRINGLPNDEFSAQNAVIVDRCRRYPLMIDPQRQANFWIKEIETINGLKVTKFLYPDYQETLQSCLETGTPLLIENVEEHLEVSLDEILSTPKEDFRLYLTTILRNPNYSAEVFNKVIVVNFSLPEEGLRDQLLDIVVSREKPELQAKREDILKEDANNKAELLRVEEEILKTLTESEGDILENEKGIQILGASKLLSERIKSEQIEAVQRQKSIEDARSIYSIVSDSSALLYYCIFDLATLNPMYRFSLQWFVNLYIKTIENSGKGRDVDRRLANLITSISYNLYTNVSRSLYQNHRLLFSFILCTKILFSKHLLTKQDYFTFLHDSIDYSQPNPTYEKIPDTFTPIQKLTIIKTHNPQLLQHSIKTFVDNHLGVKFSAPPRFKISTSYNESNAITPLIFLLSPDSDPMSSLTSFARTKNIPLLSVSMGENTEKQAEEIILRGQQTGSWVCLQNCHVSSSWLKKLEIIWERIGAWNTKTDFRLWLTSSPIRNFPLRLLQSGIKATVEQPRVLRELLWKLYAEEPVSSAGFYKGCPKERAFTRLLFGLSVFHGVLNERKCFGRIGWNVDHLFNEVDFEVAAGQLQVLLNEYEDSFWMLGKVIGESVYGGYVEDVWDERLLMTLFGEFLNRDVSSRLDYGFYDFCRLPSKNEYEEYVNQIESLPTVYSSDIYGVSYSVGMQRDYNDSKLFLQSLINIQDVSCSTFELPEERLEYICKTTLTLLPQPITHQTNELCDLHKLEVLRYNHLLYTIKNSLNGVLLGVKGNNMFTEDLETISKEIASNSVPKIWLKASYPTLLTFPHYIASFLERMEFIRMWCKKGNLEVMWLSALFEPSSFLCRLKLTESKKMDVDFWKLSVKLISEGGLRVKGIFLEGAKWDNDKGILVDGSVVEELPEVGCSVVSEEDSNFCCPLYRTSARGEVVEKVLVKHITEASLLVKRGVALLCEKPLL